MGPNVSVDFFVHAGEIVQTKLSGTNTAGTSWAIYSDSPQPSLEKRISSWMEQYCSGEQPQEKLPISLRNLPPFTHRVLASLESIPFGKTTTYKELASVVGSPKGCRAVGNACGRNPLPLILPCHRVLSQDGLGGFSLGLHLKKLLLDFEEV